MKLFYLKRALLGTATVCLLGICAGRAVAETDLMVFPTRVVMNDKQRTAQIDVINTSPMKASYKISLVRKRMTETGTIEDISAPEPTEKFADDLVKYSPRQVTLLPGGGQTIRMIFKLPENLADGEYRSHLVFTKMASGISDLAEKESPNPTAVSMKVTVNVGISIPVIARHGNLEGRPPSTRHRSKSRPSSRNSSWLILPSTAPGRVPCTGTSPCSVEKTRLRWEAGSRSTLPTASVKSVCMCWSPISLSLAKKSGCNSPKRKQKSRWLRPR